MYGGAVVSVEDIEQGAQHTALGRAGAETENCGNVGACSNVYWQLYIIEGYSVC